MASVCVCDLEQSSVYGVENQDPISTADARRHQSSLRKRGRAVVHSSVRDFHVENLRHRGLELEPGLQNALGGFRLIGSVGSYELSALQNRADRRGYEVSIRPGPEERWTRSGVMVQRGECLHSRRDFELGCGIRQTQRRVAMLIRDVGDQRIEIIDADRRQHLGAFRRCIRNEGMR